MKSELTKKVQGDYNNKTLEYLMQFNGKVISYDIQKKIEAKLLLNGTRQVQELFCRLGFWITWLDSYKANGSRIYKVDKMKKKQ